MPKKCVVDSVLTQNSSCFGPVITKFKHGALLESSHLKSINLEVTEDSSSKDGRKFDLSFTTDKLTYSSDVPSAQCSMTIPSRKVYIALRNKSTRRVRLVECPVVPVGPQITSRSTSNTLLCQEETSSIGTTQEESWQSARKELINKFGQAKGKRFYDQADKMKVKEDSYAHKMSDAVANASITGVYLEEVQVAMSLIPPCNRQTRHLNDVYSINDILSDSDIQALDNSFSEFEEQMNDVQSLDTAITNKEMSPLTGFLMKKSLSYPQKILSQGILLYIEGLLVFSKLTDSRFQAGSLSCLPKFLPNSIRRKIYTNFSEEGKLTPMARDKAICYAIILALLSSGDFRFDFKNLISSVKIPAPKLKMLVSSTGASIVTDKIMKVTEVVLRFPLSSFDFNEVNKKKKGSKY